MVSTSNDDAATSDLIRTISRHSLAYMLCPASEMFRHYDFDPLDLLIIHAVTPPPEPARPPGRPGTRLLALPGQVW